jgi:hypothetical protein
MVWLHTGNLIAVQGKRCKGEISLVVSSSLKDCSRIRKSLNASRLYQMNRHSTVTIWAVYMVVLHIQWRNSSVQFDGAPHDSIGKFLSAAHDHRTPHTMEKSICSAIWWRSTFNRGILLCTGSWVSTYNGEIHLCWIHLYSWFGLHIHRPFFIEQFILCSETTTTVVPQPHHSQRFGVLLSIEIQLCFLLEVPQDQSW